MCVNGNAYNVVLTLQADHCFSQEVTQLDMNSMKNMIKLTCNVMKIQYCNLIIFQNFIDRNKNVNLIVKIKYLIQNVGIYCICFKVEGYYQQRHW